MKISDDTREALKRCLPDYVKEATRPDPRAGKNKFVCPFCHSGDHAGGDGAFTFYPASSSWFCFSCHRGGDIFNFVEEYEGISEFSDQVKFLSEKFGVMIKYDDDQHKTKSDPVAVKGGADRSEDEQHEPDFTDYFKRCMDNFEKYPDGKEYLKRRGISEAIARRFRVGYDPQSDPISNPGGCGASRNPARRIIIPSGSHFYLARAIDADAEKQKVNAKGCSAHLFNEEALDLYPDDVVFIVEGAIDAMSIEQEGFHAVGLNSATNTSRLTERLKEHPTKSRLAIIPDNDDLERNNDNPGRKAAEKLLKELAEINYKAVITPIGAGKHKDVNDYLAADENGLKIALNAAYEAFDKQGDEAKQKILHSYSMSDYDREGGFQEYARLNRTGFMPSGFDDLDAKLSGGFRPGLYILGGVPSQGKTTFAWQIADQMASRGEDVLFISLEQDRGDLESKSLIRRVFQDDPFSQTTEDDIAMSRYSAEKERARFRKEIGNHLLVIDGNYGMKMSEISEKISELAAIGIRPMVIIDYLQIIQPESPTMDVRLATNQIVVSARQLTRRFNIPIMILSLINRGTYYNNFSYESLKESGGIEATADVVAGLQLSITSQDHDDWNAYKNEWNEERGADLREMELKIIKNKRGSAYSTQLFDFYATQAEFKETTRDLRIHRDEEFHRATKEERKTFS